MNVPKLRFYGYDDSYKNVKLSTYAKKIFSKNKGNIITNVISNSAIYGLISQRAFFEKDIANNDNTENYYIIENGDFVYNPRKSNEAPYGPINLYKYENAGVISPLYLCFRTENIDRNYLQYYFKSPFWYRYIYLNGDSGARHDRVSIKDETFFNMNINIPCIDEQTKVSNFLSLLDKKIELQSKKIEDLKLFKKGLFNNNAFNESKNIKLGNILDEVNEKSVVNDQFDILSSTANGLFLQKEYFNKQAASENNIGYKILKRNQLVLSPQNLWLGNININEAFEIGLVSTIRTVSPTLALFVSS